MEGGITSGRRHHKWKEASQVEGGITSGRRHHKWKEASQVEGYIEKPAKVCQAVALSLP